MKAVTSVVKTAQEKKQKKQNKTRPSSQIRTRFPRGPDISFRRRSVRFYRFTHFGYFYRVEYVVMALRLRVFFFFTQPKNARRSSLEIHALRAPEESNELVKRICTFVARQQHVAHAHTVMYALSRGPRRVPNPLVSFSNKRDSSDQPCLAEVRPSGLAHRITII